MEALHLAAEAWKRLWEKGKDEQKNKKSKKQ
jgi:hypothetical protein